MKPILLLLVLLTGMATACSKADPSPAVAAGPSVIYTDATGNQAAITTYRTLLITPPASVMGQERRILLFRSTLPNGTVLDAAY